MFQGIQETNIMIELLTLFLLALLLMSNISLVGKLRNKYHKIISIDKIFYERMG